MCLALEIPGNIFRSFQSPLWTWILQLFLLRFWAASFAPTVSPVLGSCDFKQLQLINAPWKGCSQWVCSESGQIKKSPTSGSYQTGQIVTVLWEQGIWGSSKPILHPPVAARFFSDTVVGRLLVFRDTLELGRGRIEIGQVKAPQISVFLLRLGHFSWINIFWIVASLWLISRVLKKLILTIFSSVTAFM